MQRDDLKELHYITHITNVRSILIRGIYCYRRAQTVEHKSFAMVEVQELRDWKQIPDGLPLHNYVNLYICARNPALYKRHTCHQDLCVLRVDPDIVDRPGVVVADRNAASSSARFGCGAEALALVDHDLVFSPAWKHPGDPDRQDYHKKVKCAEVLVPDRVPGKFVFGAYVSGAWTRDRLRQMVPELKIVVFPHFFFL